jgi:hypothetical protein
MKKSMLTDDTTEEIEEVLDSWVDSEDWSVLDLMLPALWELGMSLVS